jgi:hypothetical protein
VPHFTKTKTGQKQKVSSGRRSLSFVNFFELNKLVSHWALLNGQDESD